MLRKLLPVLALALIAVGGWALFGPSNTTQTAIPSFDGDFATAQGSGEPLPDMFQGDADAPVTIIEYASFTCPHCGRFHADVYPELKTKYIEPGHVKFIYREVYFDKFGLWAGMIARCGGEDRYFGIVDLLYEKQDEWTRGDTNTIVQNLYGIGRLAGLNDEQMAACIRDQSMAESLVADYQLKAGQDGVSSTPSFVIDGETMSNMSLDEFVQIIDSKL